MIDRLRQAAEHLDQLSEVNQEQLAILIEGMWRIQQLPPFDPTQVPQDDRDFEADMEALDIIRGKKPARQGEPRAVPH